MQKQRVQELQQMAIERSLSALKKVEKESKSGSGMHSSFSGSMDEVIEEDEV